MLGVDALSASSGIAATMANAGPGLGSIIGPVGNYQPLSDAAKWVLSFSMLIGRLEIFVILLLLMPMTWRKG